MHAVIGASLTSLSGMVDEDDGAVEVCVQLNHRPINTIVTATLTTQPLTATGLLNSHGAPPQMTDLTAWMQINSIRRLSYCSRGACSHASILYAIHCYTIINTISSCRRRRLCVTECHPGVALWLSQPHSVCECGHHQWRVCGGERRSVHRLSVHRGGVCWHRTKQPNYCHHTGQWSWVYIVHNRCPIIRH